MKTGELTMAEKIRETAVWCYTDILDAPLKQIRILDLSGCISREEIEFELYCDYLKGRYTNEAAAKMAEDESINILADRIKEEIIAMEDYKKSKGMSRQIL